MLLAAADPTPPLATADLALLILIGVFALWGAYQGAARQVAQVIAGIGAWFAARPIGEALGPTAASSMHASLVVGTVAATFATFILVFVLVRYLFTRILRRLLSGKDPGNRTADRVIGLLIGGAKVAGLTWVVICMLSFVEANVSVQGRKFGFLPQDSLSFALARKYNLFEMSQFNGIADVVRVVSLQNDPKTAAKIKQNPDYLALIKDPRFAAVLEAPGLKKATNGGDTRALLQNNNILELLQDELAMKRISRIAELSEK